MTKDNGSKNGRDGKVKAERDALVTAAGVYHAYAIDVDDLMALRSLVASALGPDAVGPDGNASWYRWDVRRRAAGR